MDFNYKWKKAAQIKIKPDVAVAELERIRAKNGYLKPEDVVEEAKRKTSRLHDYFVWDDSEAAQKYRIWQARHLIAVLVVVRTDDESDEPLTVRAYAHMKDDEENENAGPHYVNVLEGMTDLGMRERILADALKELAAFRRKYADLKELAAIFAEVDKIAV